MATLGGNSVHAATAVVTGGAKAALAARQGEDFPPGALAALAAEGIDLAGLVDIPGPTVRNWVIYEADGRRHWLYRTPPQRTAEVAPEPADLDPALLRRAAVVHVAAMPLGNAERIVAHVRRQAPGAAVTVDTHESWDSSVAGRVLALAAATAAAAITASGSLRLLRPGLDRAGIAETGRRLAAAAAPNSPPAAAPPTDDTAPTGPDQADITAAGPRLAA